MVVTIAVVGAGPGGAGLLERLVANSALLDGVPIRVVLVDPHPPGAGRVWRRDQSPLLRMNSMAEDVTMFTDESVQMDGPVRPGPTLAEWADRARAGEVPLDDEPAAAEILSVRGRTFPIRQVQSAYLRWFFSSTVAEAPFPVEVVRDRVLSVSDSVSGCQVLALASGASLEADLVVLAIGHLDARPSGEERRLARHAARHDLAYRPPEYTADADLSAVAAGEDVLVRGLGLVFVDLVVLLTEGRGGRFSPSTEGGLVYHPSGREPRILAGSRRGVPYHSKIGYQLQGGRPDLPRFFGPAAIDRLLATGPDVLDFRRDVWPLIAKELGWGFYRELITGHPDAVRLSLDEFSSRWSSDEDPAALAEELAPDPADRLDLAAFDRPLRGLAFASAGAFQSYVRQHVVDDRARREDPRFSADLGAFMALLSVYGTLPRLLAAGRLAPLSQLADVDGWWHSFFSFYASGPPGHRLDELLALSRAGIVRFLGPDLRVDAVGGGFEASSPAVPGVVRTRALIEARLPRATVADSAEQLVHALRDAGALSDEVLRDSDGAPHPTGRLLVRAADLAVIAADGKAHPRRYAVGAPTSRRAAAAFARPNTNAAPFRQNDALARELLGRAVELADVRFVQDPAAS